MGDGAPRRAVGRLLPQVPRQPKGLAPRIVSDQLLAGLIISGFVLVVVFVLGLLVGALIW